jgi:hypothetical protein
VERLESPQAASLFLKLINVRDDRSIALVTNVDFEKWCGYLSDPPLAMAFRTGSRTARPTSSSTASRTELIGRSERRTSSGPS